MITVKQLIQAKEDTGAISVASTDNVYRALEVMAENNIGAVLVIENDQMVGIFTERDYARKVILQGRCSLDTAITEIMTDQIITVQPEQTLEECMVLMAQKQIRHLPVLENKQLAGIISMRDVVDAIISDKENLIKNLEDYILGTGYPR
ncbi:MAG: CBS domain-containing protein [Anaerolineales bacterium]|nr:CBS domain-containing protein [Anaerolineales bacterium]